MTKTILLLPLALGLGLTLAGCDTVSDAADATGNAVSNVASALDPTTWFGSDAAPSDADTADAADNGVSTDTTANTTPDLASLPSRPATTPTAQNQATAQSLAADGAQARYSADALRAGTEAAAAPPPAADLPPTTQMAMASPSADAPPSTDMTPPAAQAAAPTPAAARPTPASPPPAAMAAAAPVSAAPPPSALTQGTAAVAVPGGVQATALPPPTSAAASPGAVANPVGASASSGATTPVASARPPGAEPAVPAVPPNTPVRGSGVTGTRFASDADLGFRPSQAPALNSSISQWVSAPVVARYRETASGAGVAPVRMAAVPPKGAPETMSGAMTGNDAVSTPGAGMAAMNSGIAPTTVVYFAGDGAALSKAAIAQIRSAAEQFKATGGGGSVRVVGHASSRTANMPVEKHLETIFKKSQDRANAVAKELIHQGVPAAKVLIDAVGDSQPVYYESMPQGEEGNRRAEIFVQS